MTCNLRHFMGLRHPVHTMCVVRNGYQNGTRWLLIIRTTLLSVVSFWTLFCTTHILCSLILMIISHYTLWCRVSLIFIPHTGSHEHTYIRPTIMCVVCSILIFISHYTHCCVAPFWSLFRTPVHTNKHTYEILSSDGCADVCIDVCVCVCVYMYGVATVSRID